MMHRSETYWMRRCLALAENGAGSVSPNPMVGAVIVKDGRCLGEGYHRRFGEPHAEIEAIRQARSKGYELRGATVYVSLEPCSHHGKTPPCTDALIAEGVAAVVVAVKDPNPLVSGRGISALRKAGIACRVGVLADEAEHLNTFFFHFIRHKLPWVTLKAAQTADGFIAREDGSSRWISSRASRTMVHRLRSRYDAVIVGAGTVHADDPSLTVRLVRGRNPLRVVIDGRLSVSPRSTVFNKEAPTIVYTSTTAAARNSSVIAGLEQRGVEVVALPARGALLSVRRVLKDLGQRGIASVLVEGGAGMYTQFMNERSVNDRYLFTAPKKFGKGLRTFSGISVSYSTVRRVRTRCGTDRLLYDQLTFSRVRR